VTALIFMITSEVDLLLSSSRVECDEVNRGRLRGIFTSDQGPNFRNFPKAFSHCFVFLS